MSENDERVDAVFYVTSADGDTFRGFITYVRLDWSFNDPTPVIYHPSFDQAGHDLTPDLCWRCDEAAAADDVGLCAPCRADLTGARP